jgi:hypothetical protein
MTIKNSMPAAVDKIYSAVSNEMARVALLCENEENIRP